MWLNLITSALVHSGRCCINHRLSVCLLVCEWNNSKRYGWIFMKFGELNCGPEKSWLSFGRSWSELGSGPGIGLGRGSELAHLLVSGIPGAAFLSGGICAPSSAMYAIVAVVFCSWNLGSFVSNWLVWCTDYKYSTSVRCTPVYSFLTRLKVNVKVITWRTRWLYCVECTQYSIRLEALGYI